MSFAATYAGHTLHLITEYTAEKANGCNDGKTAGVYCDACDEWIVPREVEKAPHYPSDWIVEGTVTDCTKGYNSYKKCTKCGVVVEKKTINEHKFKTVSVNQPYCDTEGVIKKECEVCPIEVTQTAEVKAHVWGPWETKTLVSCTIDGYETRKCTQCLRVEEKKNVAPGHDYQIVEGSSKLPTCKEEGSEASWACTVCGDLDAGKKIAKKKHIDSNKDNYCDRCDTYFTAELPDGCTCPCHEKSGIRKFFFQVSIFFLSLFGVNATCGCGLAHYEVRKLF